MTSRERFEAWLKDRFPHSDTRRFSQTMFIAWQAAEQQALERAKELCIAREERGQSTSKRTDRWFVGFTEGIRTGARHCACEIDEAIRALNESNKENGDATTDTGV
jgi:hypothetical protein